jgi:hypothetical protein
MTETWAVARSGGGDSGEVHRGAEMSVITANYIYT